MKLFYTIAPSHGPYAASFRCDNKREARRLYAAFLGLSRCPNFTQVWESD